MINENDTKSIFEIIEYNYVSMERGHIGVKFFYNFDTSKTLDPLKAKVEVVIKLTNTKNEFCCGIKGRGLFIINNRKEDISLDEMLLIIKDTIKHLISSLDTNLLRDAGGKFHFEIPPDEEILKEVVRGNNYK